MWTALFLSPRSNLYCISPVSDTGISHESNRTPRVRWMSSPLFSSAPCRHVHASIIHARRPITSTLLTETSSWPDLESLLLTFDHSQYGTRMESAQTVNSSLFFRNGLQEDKDSIATLSIIRTRAHIRTHIPNNCKATPKFPTRWFGGGCRNWKADWHPLATFASVW